MEAEPPELDAACVSRVLSFVHGAATMGAALRVSRLWRRCGRDATLPVWAEMDAARFRALHLGAAEPRFCACAVVHSLRRGAGRTLRRLDLSAATACNACSIHFFGRMGTVRLSLGSTRFGCHGSITSDCQRRRTTRSASPASATSSQSCACLGERPVRADHVVCAWARSADAL